MITQINNYGDLLAALLLLSPEQLTQPVRASQDEQPIVEVEAIEITEEDLVQTDEALELKSLFTDHDLKEFGYSTIYKSGSVILDLKSL